MAQDDDLEAVLLGAPARYTRDEVSAMAGADLDEARALWRALGFPEVAPDDRAFTERDADALRAVLLLRDSGLAERDVVVVLARAMGQAMSRLAESQVAVLSDAASGLPEDVVVEATTEAARDLLPLLERLVVHVWRRQFAAASARALAVRGEGQPVRAVAFVDLVDFTRATQEWDVATLERTLERFEAATSERIARVGGLVVKTLGDEVLYTADSADAAVEVALETVQAHEADPDLPAVRAGVALGPVLLRLGDVYGQPVNLASRLTDEARPGSVLVDAEVARVLEADASYEIVRLRRRSVRGYRALTPYLLRRADPRPHERKDPA